MTRDRKKTKREIESNLGRDNQFNVINGRSCFKTASGGYLRLDTLGGSHDAIVIEFAENKREANSNRFEDGDVLDLREYTEDDILEIVSRAIKEY